MGDTITVESQVLEKLVSGMEKLAGHVGDVSKSLGEKLDAFDKRMQAMEQRAPAVPNAPNGKTVGFSGGDFQAPYMTSGEVCKDSRGYQFARLLKAMKTGDKGEAKQEYGVHQELLKLGYASQDGGILVPLNARWLPIAGLSDIVCRGAYEYFDPQTIMRLKQASFAYRYWQQVNRALGENTDPAGGYLVSPTQAGEIIDLLRARAVVQSAGAREMPLGQSGQLDMPKLISGYTAEWVGEGKQIKENDPKFGMLSLRAKKLAVRGFLSNELLLDSTPAVEPILRNDIAQTIALKEDLTWFQGAGTTVEPRGIINDPDIAVLSTGANGDDITAEDIDKFTEQITTNNGIPEAFFMHPRTIRKIKQLRAGSGFSADDGKGPFLFDVTRDVESSPFMLGRLSGVPVWITTQIPVNRTKGTGTALTYVICAMVSEAIIGRRAVMELRMSDQAGVSFENDQTMVRAIARSDFGLRQPTVFCLKDHVK